MCCVVCLDEDDDEKCIRFEYWKDKSKKTHSFYVRGTAAKIIQESSSDIAPLEAVPVKRKLSFFSSTSVDKTEKSNSDVMLRGVSKRRKLNEKTRSVSVPSNSLMNFSNCTIHFS